VGYGVHAQQWKVVLGELWSWADEHGDVRELPAGRASCGVDLRRWVSARRHEHRGGELSPEQVVALEQLPGWTWGLGQQQRWHATFAVLCTWVEAHGTAHVPTTTVVDGVRLGAWVSSQRSSHRAGTLPLDRGRALAALPGWTWAPGR